MSFAPLDPISVPLNQRVLIEASAGTGKTYTIGSLYLRLLLNLGEQKLPRPLEVDEILVVTFTEAATMELRQKIRERIHQLRQVLQQISSPNEVSLAQGDVFLQQIINELGEGIELAIMQLRLAEENMDKATIFTIHSFCRRMLLQYAFDAGSYFQIELEQDSASSLRQISEQVWREHFYPLKHPTLVGMISNWLTNPSTAYNIVKPLLTFKPIHQEAPFLHTQLSSLAQDPIFEQVSTFKHRWLQIADNFQSWFATVISQLNGNSYSVRFMAKLPELTQWASSPKQILPPSILKILTKLSPEELASKTKKNHTTPEHPFLVEIAQFLQYYTSQITQLRYNLYWLYAQAIKQKQQTRYQQKQEKDFEALIILLKQALCDSPQGDRLAKLIRHQYPFAMVDEFQDTDYLQYHIFSTIYAKGVNNQSGFIMIGDPKQAIYQFRGADIFTYLEATDSAQQQFTLNKNWRSSREVVGAVNQLFNIEKPAFLYAKIQFHPVDYQHETRGLYINNVLQAPIEVYLSQGSSTSKKRDQEKQEQGSIAKMCASSIARWLALRKAQAYLDKTAQQPILAKNIAVLVRNKHEAKTIKDALMAQNIASVFLSEQASVYDSPQANALLLILKACLEPHVESYIRNALGTTLLGFNATELLALRQDENAWEEQVTLFMTLHQKWQTVGVLPMLQQLFRAYQMPQRYLGQPNGERVMTDLLHLAELLQQASQTCSSEQELLTWYEQRLSSPNSADEQQRLRLESELDLVKIVTIHKSKGLEYDLVWLPFIAWSGDYATKNDLYLYHDEQQKLTWHTSSNPPPITCLKEQKAEELRLLYVAMTRAKQQIVIGMPETFTAQSNWNSLLYLLTRGNLPLQAKVDCDYDARQLIVQQPLWHIASPQELAVEQPYNATPNTLNATNLKASEFQQSVEQNWRTTSFSGLALMQHYRYTPPFLPMTLDEARDYDVIPSTLSSVSPVFDFPLIQEEYTPHTFPKGIRVGMVLHDFLQFHPFHQVVSLEQVAPVLKKLQLEEIWLVPTQHWLQAILHTPIVNTVCLADLNPQDYLTELPFFFPIEQVMDHHRFNQILQAHHIYFRPEFPYYLEQIKGMLRGFIDLVFRVDGKYYVSDYKSNFLGNQIADYDIGNLILVMQQHFYDLQYLIYCVALHRHLRQRITDYDYEQHFGGVYYLFLRGMTGQVPANYSGVFFDRPSALLIEQLDQFFKEVS